MRPIDGMKMKTLQNKLKLQEQFTSGNKLMILNTQLKKIIEANKIVYTNKDLAKETNKEEKEEADTTP